MQVKSYSSFIDGRFLESGELRDIKSPGNGETIARVQFATLHEVEDAIDAAYTIQDKWAATALKKRKQLLSRLAEIIQSRSDEYIDLETRNTGKTIRQTSFMDVPLAIEHLSYFGNERRFKSEAKIEHPEYPGTYGIVQNAPMGVVAAVVPWNVPLLMAIWKLGPALLTGNTVVLKPSSYTPITALELARDSIRAGFPPGVLNVIAGKGSVIGNTLVRSNKVNMVSFTGSSSTGREIMRDSSESLKKVVLELGGKSPNIVFSDADLKMAAKGVLFGIYLNSGQLCESGSRLIVENSVREQFLSEIKRLLLSMRDGDPLDYDTDISAITTQEQLEKIEEIVAASTRSGATEFAKRQLKNTPKGGRFYPPSILTDLSIDMKISDEEIFGPVLSVYSFDSEREAVEIANSTRYGLAAGVWSGDTRKCKRVSSGIKAGTVWINDYHLLSANAPRGGFKDSGIGRELGFEGIMEYTQTRHLFVNTDKNDLDNVAYGLVTSSED